MNLLNLFESATGSDILFYVLMILLVIVTIVLSYLIYSQNKEMARKLKENSLFDEVPKKEEDTASTITEVETLRPQIVQVTNAAIPDYLELTQSFNVVPENDDLQSITRELEALPKERKIEMTPYEAEQEETAIISYDELIKQADEVNVKEPQLINSKTELFETVDDIDEIINEYQRKNNSEVEVPVINKTEEPETSLVNDKNIESVNRNYVHEEKFLSGLKSLLSMLRD